MKIEQESIPTGDRNQRNKSPPKILKKNRPAAGGRSNFNMEDFKI